MDDGGRGGNTDKAVNIKRVENRREVKKCEREENNNGAEHCDKDAPYSGAVLGNANRQKWREQRGNIDLIGEKQPPFRKSVWVAEKLINDLKKVLEQRHSGRVAGKYAVRGGICAKVIYVGHGLDSGCPVGELVP